MTQASPVRDFGDVFRLMRKYDGASQDRLTSPVEGLTRSRVSKIMRDKDRVATVDVIERIADALCIPGTYFRIAPRAWEDPTQPTGISVIHDNSPSVIKEPAGELIDRRLSLDIDVPADGAVTLNHRQELSDPPLCARTREVWDVEDARIARSAGGTLASGRRPGPPGSGGG